MSVLSVIQPTPEEAQARPQQAATPYDDLKSTGWLDSTGSQINLSVDDDPLIDEMRRRRVSVPVVNAVAKAMGKSATFGYVSPWKAAWSMLPMAGKDTTDYDAVQRDIDLLRQQGRLPEGVPTNLAAAQQAAANRGDGHLRDKIIASQGPFSARLAGGLIGGLADPVQTGLAIATGGLSSELSVGRAILMEGLVNAAGVAVELPAMAAVRARRGEEVTAGDAAMEVGTAFAFGAVAGLGLRGAGAAYRAGREALAIPERTNPVAVVKAFAKAVPEQLRTPEQMAAVDVIERDADVQGRNPFDEEGADAHRAKIDAAQRAIVEPPPLPSRTGASAATRAPITGDANGAVDAYMAAARRQESSGSDTAANPRSSATGRYQFTDGTWVHYYHKTFPQSGMTRAAILQRRLDGETQDRVMRVFTQDNAAFLQRIGVEPDPGNLYVVHHLGQGGAEAVLHASPSAPLSALLPQEVIVANPHLRTMTAGQFVDWAAERMGGRGSGGAMRVAARPDAMPDEASAIRTAADYPDPIRPEVPQLRRDAFPDETSWNIAQAKVEADTLGLPEPSMAQASIARSLDPGTFRDYKALQIRRELDLDLLQRLGGERQALPQVRELQDRIDTILTKVGGVESRLTNVAAARLDEARASLKQMLSSDTPYMQLVRQRLLKNDFRMRDLAPKVAEANRRAADMVPETALEQAPAPPLREEGLASVEGRGAPPLGPIAERTGGAAEGAAVRPIAPPDLRQDALPMADHMTAKFADPAAAEIRAQADGHTHDLEGEREAGAWREVAFGTGAPVPESIAQALGRLDDEDMALKALKDCL
ncbi:hypothetical protein [Novosphingobium sp.]|uniref:hypothetical protein n=1 Tax=Novosphingobium sp. TaxID=1874826 RepID=UPI0026065552|nr:hypothetical protein [Novosphingobium sp.]